MSDAELMRLVRVAEAARKEAEAAGAAANQAVFDNHRARERRDEAERLLREHLRRMSA